MPALVFTFAEVMDAALKASVDLSDQILDLSDLDKRPLDPGESPDARRHKIARLGKQLAEVVKQMDTLVATRVAQIAAEPVSSEQSSDQGAN